MQWDTVNIGTWIWKQWTHRWRLDVLSGHDVIFLLVDICRSQLFVFCGLKDDIYLYEATPVVNKNLFKFLRNRSSKINLIRKYVLENEACVFLITQIYNVRLGKKGRGNRFPSGTRAAKPIYHRTCDPSPTIANKFPWLTWHYSRMFFFISEAHACRDKG